MVLGVVSMKDCITRSTVVLSALLSMLGLRTLPEADTKLLDLPPGVTSLTLANSRKVFTAMTKQARERVRANLEALLEMKQEELQRKQVA